MNTGPANTFLKHGEIMADMARSFVRGSILTEPKIEYKIDGSPVTNFDKELELILREYIHDKYPEHGIIGEELTAVNPSAEFVWLVDPIDGTLAFLTGIPVYGTLISLLHDGFPILGIIDIPMTGDRWVGQKNKKTLHNDRFIKTSDCKTLSEATLSTSSPDYYDETNINVFKALQSSAIQTVYGGSCVAYGQIASGRIDLGIDANFDIHDFLPLIPIIEGAGGLLTNWQGETLSKESGTENMLASANSYLHDQALEKINNL
jgi:inositol-phosphate phosphatase/L-galactose 1-phosphate phosphatase/histidinol-phosphatase